MVPTLLQIVHQILQVIYLTSRLLFELIPNKSVLWHLTRHLACLIKVVKGGGLHSGDIVKVIRLLDRLS